LTAVKFNSIAGRCPDAGKKGITTGVKKRNAVRPVFSFKRVRQFKYTKLIDRKANEISFTPESILVSVNGMCISKRLMCVTEKGLSIPIGKKIKG
jgi:hypothetical protein